jgi:hypothetical protein
MTNFTARLTIAAATLVVAAGSASAQVLKAEIPFTFRAGSVVLAAGTYQVSADHKNGQPMYRLWSETDHKSILLVAGAARDPQQAWVANGHPVLSFECGVSHCALAGIWAGSETPAYTFPRHKLGRDEPTRTAVVLMRPSKGE